MQLHNSFHIKLFLACAFISFLSMQGFSQITFQKGLINVLPFYNYGTSLIETYDKNYVSVSNYADTIHIIKIDTTGLIQWRKDYHFTQWVIVHDITETYDSGIIIAGSTTKSGIGYSFLIKVDLNGDFLWYKRYGGNFSFGSYSILETKRKEILITGGFYDTSGHYISLIKTDSAGTLLWSKSYGGFIRHGGWDVCETFDKGYMLYGGVFMTTFKLLLIRTDSIGNILWANTYSDSTYNWPTGIIQTKDSNFVVLIDKGLRLIVLEIDSSGSIIRNNAYLDVGNINGEDIIQTKDGGFAISGSKESQSSTQQKLFLLKIDRTGNIQWLNRYLGIDSLSNHYESRLKQTADLGFIINTKEDASFSSNYFVKTDSLGRSGCYQIDTSVTLVPHSFTVAPVSISDTSGGTMFIDSIIGSTSSFVDSFICLQCTVSLNIPDTSICLGESIQILFDTGLIYNINPGIYVDKSTIQNQIITPLQAATYRVYFVDTNYCVGLDTFTINLFDPPVGLDTIYGTPFVCPQDTNIDYWVEDTIGSTFNWVISGGIINSGQGTDSITVNWDSSGNGYVAVMEITPDGCVGDTVFFPVNVNVVWTPNAPVGMDTFCSSPLDSFTYTTSYTFGANYYWHLQGGKILSGDSTPNVVIKWDTVGTIPLSYIEENVTIDTICYNSSDTLWVTIFPLPTIKTISGDMRVCDFDAGLVYSVNDTAGSIYTWNLQGGTITSGNGTNTITIDWDSSGTYQLSVVEVNPFGCIGDTMDTVIDVFDHPATAGIFGDLTICAPDTVALPYGVNGFGNSFFDWSISGGIISSGVGSDSITIDWDMSGSGYITIVEISADSCPGDTLTLSITLSDPIIELDLVTTQIDIDDNIDIQWSLYRDTITDKTFYIFRRASKPVSSWTQVQTVASNFYEDKSLSTSSQGYDYVIAGLNVCRDTVFSDLHHSILLTGNSNEALEKVSLSWNEYINWNLGVDRYEVWRKLDNEPLYTMYASIDADTATVFNNGKDGYAHCYRIAAYELGGSKISWSNELCLDFKHILSIPNAFSPNGDGVNYTWVIENLELQGGNTLEIYNRWGNLIYQTKNYNNDFDGNRDGIDPYAKELPDGNYYYILKVNEPFGNPINKY
ncbi:MAG: gliding motility-associated C-terminal domain-containing protein, partial [Bacteroidetes bacterium]|nr:gliding motility-associated C-terminal domain-containing protein [Bacteroidota bacterium]